MERNNINPATFTERMIVFIIGTRIVHAMNLKDVNIDDVVRAKEILAAEENIHPDEITVDFMGEDRELSDCHISPQGLEFRTLYGSLRVAEGVKPAFNLNTEAGFDLFMDLISQKEYNEAIDFF